MRRCIGCYNSFPQEDLLRLTLVNGVVTPDDDEKSEGRGIYLCRNTKCIETAIKKNAFNRAFKKAVDVETNRQLINQLINKTKEE